MSRLVIIILLILPIISNAQIEKYIFQYLEEGVKKVKLNDCEISNYEYKEGVIIETESCPLNVKRYYYYSNVGKIDSIIYCEIDYDTIYISKGLYEYDEKSRLVRTQFGEDTKNEIIRIDSFIYNSDNLLDSILWFSNRTEGIFGTKRMDDVRLYAFTVFKYDEFGKLVLEKSTQPFGAKEVKYFYNQDGRVSRAIKFFGLTRDGCIIGEDKRYSTIDYYYNELGLVKKEVIEYYLTQPSGRKERIDKYRLKKKYTFY